MFQSSDSGSCMIPEHIYIIVQKEGNVLSSKRKNQSIDRRARYTQNIIRSSLLSLMRQKPFTKITVTEICKQSEINRGTFYLHYYDLDDVLDDIIEQTIQDTTQIFDHVMCPEKDRCTYPFCRKVQESQEFRILFSDETASARLLDKLCELSKEDFITRLMQNSLLSYEQAEAILYFQMNGCLSINKRMIKNNCRDWGSIQKAIDQFIKSGLESFLIKDERQNLRDPQPGHEEPPTGLRPGQKTFGGCSQE